MTIAASTIITRAADITQDTTNVRWPVAELVRWFNDAQREVALYRPEASVSNTQITLSSGNTKQTISGVSGAIRLISIIRNFDAAGTVPGRAVRLVSREILDAQIPTWHSDAGAAEVKHYVFDGRDPKTFYVYPKPTGASKVEAIVSVSPTDVTESGGAAVGNLALDDIYANAVLDYILHRAYLKDSEYAGNAQRAIAHYQSFANAIGIRFASDVKASPVTNSTFNPNNPIAQSGGSAAA